MNEFQYFNGQRWLAIQLSNYSDDSAPPPNTKFIISEIEEKFLIRELSGVRIITEK